ncbi:MAG TPA: MBOAT family protein, partial [Polyangiaceae bacterium]
ALGYYKYANFLVGAAGDLTGSAFRLAPIVLPLAISFFTFIQIAYLVDTYRRPHETRKDFGEYLLFVTFFPHLLAGPIVHHGDLMRQFSEPSARYLRSRNLVVGASIFVVGLLKKTLLADTFSDFVPPVFDAAAAGQSPTFVEAWTGALFYTLQLYFDFSGYSDMAIGLARMFGIYFPANFDSPYKATSIVDFWRRWHITLSSFLRDYIYIPLGGNRKGKLRRYVNLFLTMLIGGIWHGAGWTFVVWGALHGTYLVVNHAFVALRERLGWNPLSSTALGTLAARAITFVAVVVGWVYFRAPSLDGAHRILAGMAGLNGVVLQRNYVSELDELGGLGSFLAGLGLRVGDLSMLLRPPRELAVLLVAGYGIAWFLPNSGQLFERFHNEKRSDVEEGVPRWYHWQPSARWAMCIGVIAAVGLAAVAGHSEFIYFQF